MLEIITPKTLKFSICPFTFMGLSLYLFFRKFITISLILLTFSSRLFSKHRLSRTPTSLLYTDSSLSEIRSIMVMSSANFMILSDSWVWCTNCSVHWVEECVQNVALEENMLDFHHFLSIYYIKSPIPSGIGLGSPLSWLICQTASREGLCGKPCTNSP